MAAMTAAIVTSAAVITAGMLLTVMMVVVIAFCIRIKRKRAGDISRNGIIRVAVDTAKQLDPCLCKSDLSTTADASADEDINTEIGKQS